ncbi:hypothetical protein AK830_g10541 [Neonectria ditissima]|uniref:Uncharacterized protein n=1 Tax=Neonectria ditissima TaxID=78410 RepID=A0A0P7B6D4_9HYPO|nr:hypothetical protein AK830_g10541 [Neonectria ditissima]
MSLVSVFGSAHQGNGMSASLQRRLRLLQAVLPTLTGAAAQKYYSTKKFGSVRAFWTGFLSPCLIMESSGWLFYKLDNQHDELVTNLLDCLQKLVNMDKSAITEASITFSSSPNSGFFKTLRKMINESSSEIEEFPTEHWELVKPANKQDCTILLELLAELAQATQDSGKQPPPEESLAVTSRAKASIAPLILNLFSTISDYCRCKCVLPHKAMLLLFTHRCLPKNDDPFCFTIFLSRAKLEQGKPWQEAGVSIKDRTPKADVRIVFPKMGLCPKGHPLARGSDLCKTIHNTTASRLNLNIDGDLLFQQSESPSQAMGLDEAESISLRDGLFSNETELDIKSKVCLAVVLSYSLLDFCWEPWFPRGWTKRGISLLQHSRKMLLRPTLITHMSPRPKNPETIKVSSDLKLLIHAILLMEIFKQDSLPFEEEFKRIDINDLRSKVQREFDIMKWDVSEGFRQSVAACLDGFQYGALDNADDTEESFAAHFCKSVINPLERDFISLWGDKDPDQVLSELSLPSIKSKRRSPPPTKPKPDHLKQTRQERPPRPSKLKPCMPGSLDYVVHDPIAPTGGRLKLKLFDVENKPDHRSVQGASRWFDRFDEACANRAQISQQDGGKKFQIKGKGIKIAVLDTGIDLNNAWISSKAGRVKCWPSEDSCKDTDGHGTHVAYLLLRLAPLVQLHIAKVSKSQMLQDAADVEEIAKSIEHFSSPDGELVDIINLSFGFPLYHETLRPILLALRKARDNGVLLFAAAGNEGGNYDVSWPAKLPDVICVNAADSYGNMADFAQTDAPRRRIYTLGEGVPSCELDAKGEDAIHRSGTSFATPIAVGIAAIVLGFTDNTEDLDVPADFESLKPRLRTRSGMESVLCKVCVLQGTEKRAGSAYIAPWFFLKIEELSRVGIIMNELRSCPE